jgi:hypothetical protein
VIPNRPAICLIALFALQSAPSTAATDFNPSVEAWSRDIDRVVAAAVTVDRQSDLLSAGREHQERAALSDAGAACGASHATGREHR